MLLLIKGRTPRHNTEGVLTAKSSLPGPAGHALSLVREAVTIGRVLRELLVIVLAALVLAPRPVSPGLDIRGDVLPEDNRLGSETSELVGRSDSLENHLGLDLHSTVLSGADGDIDPLTADRVDSEGRVLTLDPGDDTQVDGISKPSRLQVGGGRLHLAGLLDSNRRERAVGHIRQLAETETEHDHERHEHERREGAIHVEPLLTARAAAGVLVAHGNLLDGVLGLPHTSGLLPPAVDWTLFQPTVQVTTDSEFNDRLECDFLKQ